MARFEEECLEMVVVHKRLNCNTSCNSVGMTTSRTNLASPASRRHREGTAAVFQKTSPINEVIEFCLAKL